MDVPQPTPYARDILSHFQRKSQSLRRQSACGRHFYNTKVFELWMGQTAPNEQYSNTELLLRALEPKIREKSNRPFPLRASEVLDTAARCVLVFAILLEQGRGEFIELFRSAGIVDRDFLHSTSHHHNNLKTKAKKQQIAGVDEIIHRFEDAKWAFNPVPLEAYMSSTWEHGNWILPFCRREVVNDKGGTASVDQIAVMEEFVPPELQKMLHRSAYRDKEYGPCYRMALKVFDEEQEDTYEAERDALSTLSQREHRGNLVRYLGCFVHGRDKDGKAAKTFNILLEYGENDLDEYFALTAPPTGFEETLRFWENLFRLAEALRTVHRFSYDQSEHYDGWHGDVKPDNILMVHNDLKLADFGFARFQRRGKDVPKEKIGGGTKTYSAPEVGFKDNKKVEQTIDIWSFGAVLSMAGTWVVFGNKGILEYHTLRRLAISKRRGQHAASDASDAFHDGKNVLPEIREWHRHLREHMRRCDTITEHVLELVDNHMLQDSPRYRYTCDDLSAALQRILNSAKNERQDMIHDGKIKETDETILQALYTVEQSPDGRPALAKHDENTLSLLDRRQVEEWPTVQAHTDNTLLIPPLPVQKSRRIGKPEKLGQIPLSKTSHRESALEDELRQRGKPLHVKSNEPAGKGSSIHEVSATTKNAEHHELAPTSLPNNGKGRNTPEPDSGSFNTEQSSTGLETDVALVYPSTTGIPPKTNPTISVSSSTGSLHPQVSTPIRRSSDFDVLNPHSDRPQTSWLGLRPSLHEYVPAKSVVNSEVVPPDCPPESVQRQQNVPSGAGCSSSTPIDHTRKPLSPNSTVTTSPSSVTTPVHENFDASVVETPWPEVQPTAHIPGSSQQHYQEKEAFRPGEIVSSSASPLLAGESLRVPSSMADLRSMYDIFEVGFQEIERKKKEDVNLWKKVGRVIRGDRPEPNQRLKDFIQNRDMVIVVDNGPSMRHVRHITRFVVETLVLKLAGLDDDGLDLFFTKTQGKPKPDLSGVKKKAFKEFSERVGAAWSDTTNTIKTNMDHTLRRVFNTYQDRNKWQSKRQMTVLVLTDGTWDGTTPENEVDKVEKALVEFVKKLDEDYTPIPNRFTVQFIQIGGDEAATSRLRRFDDQLPSLYDIHDVIDFVPWTGSVDKMILGSLSEEHDKNDQEMGNEPPNVEDLCRDYYSQQKKSSTTSFLSIGPRTNSLSQNIRPSTNGSGLGSRSSFSRNPTSDSSR